MGAAVGENHEEEEGGGERGNRTKKRKGRGTRVDRVPAAINRANESPLLFRLQPRSSLHLVPHSSFFSFFSSFPFPFFFFLFSFPYLRDRRFTGNADGNWKGIEVGRRRSGPYLDHDHVVPAWLLRRGTLHRVSGHGGAAGDGGGAHRHSERVHQGAGGTSRHSEKVSALFYITNHDFYDRARYRIRAGVEPAFLNLLRAPIQLTSVTKW